MRTPTGSSAFASPAFRKYLGGTLSANIGFRVQSVALAILVYRTTGSALDLGLVSAIGAAPAMLCNVLGGVLADRHDTRLIWAINAGVSATLVGALALLVFAGDVAISQIYTLAALMGIVAGVNVPVSQSYYPSLLAPHALKSGVTLNGMGMSVASIIGPTLAGLIIAAIDLYAAFAAAAFCWSLPAFIALALPPRKTDPGQNTRSLSDFRVGFDFIRTHRLFLILIVLVVANFLLVFGWLQTLPAFIELFAGGEREIGYAFTAAGIGATLGIFLAGRLKPGARLGYLILGGTAFFAAMVTCLSFSPSFYLVLPLAFLAHTGNGLFSNSCIVAMQSRIPELIRGRVMGAVSIAFNLGTFGGMWTGGAIALLGDVRWGMAAGPLGMLVIILSVLLTQRQIRQLADTA
ncbi:MAG TPA: MFS transporter [Candidatus Latescibacteria bacterium]|nr:MFS transporter [Candidatus Latescibacterota bacterium]